MSLFAHLENKTNVVALNMQYRMNSRLTELANGLVYDSVGGLVCGSDEVAARCLETPEVQVPKEDFPSWLESTLDPSLSRSVVFLDTGGRMRDFSDAQGVKNEGEAALVAKLCRVIGERCVEATSVGVIAPYRAQVAHIRHLLATSGEKH